MTITRRNLLAAAATFAGAPLSRVAASVRARRRRSAALASREGGELVCRYQGSRPIEALDLDFARGLGVLTGETGAGKSILLDALGLVLGDR
eukprot:gene21800-41947_t